MRSYRGVGRVRSTRPASSGLAGHKWGGGGVKNAGEAALKGTLGNMENCLARSRCTAGESDGRVQVSKLVSAGGTSVMAAGKLVLK